MKKLILSLMGILFLLAILILYPEYKTRNFVDSFITSSDNLEEVVQGLTIRKDGAIVATLKPGDKQYDEVLADLSKWEIKRAVFKDTDTGVETYQMDFLNDNLKPLTTFNIMITKEGMVDIRGKEYELVSGSSIEEIIEAANP